LDSNTTCASKAGRAPLSPRLRPANTKHTERGSRKTIRSCFIMEASIFDSYQGGFMGSCATLQFLPYDYRSRKLFKSPSFSIIGTVAILIELTPGRFL